MTLARSQARELQRYARQLDGMGFKSLAEKQRKEADVWERIADEADADSDGDGA